MVFWKVFCFFNIAAFYAYSMQVGYFGCLDFHIEVEVCAGEGNLSRALSDCGYRVKAFDAARYWYYGSAIYNMNWFQRLISIAHQVRYSRNHDLLRTTGFLTILAAVPRHTR